ncbi:MAG: class I SAM-dependent methyltransferase [Armatimonadetes bacterium]|nr:class I SAM-dependent methyltransferase [Armatimonadota bacterium]
MRWFARYRGANRCEEPTRPGRGEFDAVAEHYDYLMRFVPYSGWVDYVERLMAHHGIRARRVLDLCCGTGKVGSEFSRRGYQAVGVDLSPQMARHCRFQNPPLPAAVMDARKLGLRQASIELVVSLYDSLNYILEPAGLQECFNRVRLALVPGGWFIFDMNTAYALANRLFDNSNRGSGDILEYTWRSHWDPATRICRVDMDFFWRGPDGPKQYKEVHYQRAYSEDELVEMLRAAGFGQPYIYHAYTLKPPNKWTDRIYVLAQREE